MGGKTPALSFLIPAKNPSSQTLSSVLNLLAGDVDGSVEVLLMVDGGEHSWVLDAATHLFDNRLKLIGKTGASRGAGWARNRLAEEASGEFLLFADSDTALRPAVIHGLPEALSSLPPGNIWAPRIAPFAVSNPISRFFSFFVLAPKYVAGHLVVPSTILGIKKTDWSAMGGFSEKFPEAGGEDWEWVLRNHLRNEDFGVVYDPGVVFNHRNPITINELMARAKRYGTAGALLENHFPREERKQLFPSSPRSIGKKLRTVMSSVYGLWTLSPRSLESTGYATWRGRVVTGWTWKDFLPSLLLLPLFSIMYRAHRQRALRAERLQASPVGPKKS